jgi:hypothetical protein
MGNQTKNFSLTIKKKSKYKKKLYYMLFSLNKWLIYFLNVIVRYKKFNQKIRSPRTYDLALPT